MAEEVVKTIENVDKLFSEIVVNGEVHKSNRYVSPSAQSASPSSVRSTQGEDVHAVELNDVLHNFSDPDVVSDVQTLQQGLANEVSARTTTDQALDSAITQEANARSSADEVLQTNINTVSGDVSTLQGKVSTIESEIPSQASSSNQLADKNFVNSSIATNTANFLGTYTSMADIEAIPNPTNNDYVFLQTTDSAGNSVFDRYKYNAEQGEWLFEYELNNSSFTAEQWATINSGLTSSSVSDAINALDVASAGGAGKYIQAISETNGKISATVETMDTAPTANSTKAVTSGGVKTAVDTAETNAKNLANATGTLAVAHGGTGQASLDNVTVGTSKHTSALDKYVTCSTGASTADKTVTLAGFTLVKGAKLIVYLQNANTAQSALTLNVNSTGAKTIRWNGSVTSSTIYAMTEDYYNCYYDGTYWNMDSGYESYSARRSVSATSASIATTATSSYNASAISNYVTCGTGSAVSAKTVSIAGFTLVKGAKFIMQLLSANTANNPTLNVSNTGAKTIVCNGFITKSIPVGFYNCYYNGSYWYIDSVLESMSSRWASSSYKSNARVTFTCSTTGSTVEKTVSVTGYTLSTYDEILVHFSNENTADNPTLNVNGIGAKSIRVFGVRPTSTNGLLQAGTYYCFYDGISWLCFPYQTVNEGVSYYIGATPTGGIWIDGKPIYRIVLTGTWSSGTTLLVPFSRTTYAVDKFVNIRLGVDDGNGVVFEYYYTATDFLNLYYDSANQGFSLRKGETAPRVPNTYYITVEFTKTS